MSLYGFEGNDIILPQVIFEELDKFKDGQETPNKHARDAIRFVNAIFGESNPKTWTTRGEHLGKLKVSIDDKLPKEMEGYDKDIEDNQFLATVLNEIKKDKCIIIKKQKNDQREYCFRRSYRGFGL
jgi:PhoH-like ATPase